jgi:hypothetical protein
MDKTEILRRLMYALDALDEHVVKNHKDDARLCDLSGHLLEWSAKLDPDQTIPEPEEHPTLEGAIALLSD